MSIEYRQVTGDSVGLLEKYFVSTFRKGYVRANGFLLPQYYTKFADAILNMPVRDDDVWVCSFPKTGTTWTQEMVWCLANDLDFEKARAPLPERFPFLEHSPLFDYAEALEKFSDMNLPDYVTDSVGYIAKMESPRFIKSHLPFDLLPLKLQSRLTRAKIIYITRNPKDTCVSYYHHCCTLEGYTGSFEDFVKLFVDDSVCFAPYAEHVRSYLTQKDNSNVLLVKYEDMIEDLSSVVKKTAVFLDKNITEEQVAELCHHLRFENMKANPAVNYEAVIDFNKKFNLINSKGKFMRNGKSGSWKAEMNDKTIGYFSKWEKIVTSQLGNN